MAKPRRAIQRDLFAEEETPDAKAMRLCAEAFVLHTEADEERDDERRAGLRSQAVAKEREADQLVPVERRRW